jgi:hypothetical protein
MNINENQLNPLYWFEYLKKEGFFESNNKKISGMIWLANIPEKILEKMMYALDDKNYWDQEFLMNLTKTIINLENMKNEFKNPSDLKFTEDELSNYLNVYCTSSMLESLRRKGLVKPCSKFKPIEEVKWLLTVKGEEITNKDDEEPF